MSDYSVDFSQKIRDNNIDSIGYGEVSDDLKKLSKKTSSILKFEEIELQPFPKNSSIKVKEELEHIKKQQQAVPHWHTGDYKKKIDKDFLSIYLEYLDEVDLKYDKQYIKDVLEDLNPTLLQLKIFYNRARPYQLSEHHNVDIKRDSTSTAKTPAYPSGHSFQSKVIETILTKAHPDHKRIFFQISNRVSLARILRGLHYPSDILFSFRIVEKYLEKKL